MNSTAGLRNPFLRVEVVFREQSPATGLPGRAGPVGDCPQGECFWLKLAIGSVVAFQKPDNVKAAQLRGL
jgi:hypothetical protein